MKTVLLSLLLLICYTSRAQSEEEAVKQVVTTAYIDGIHNGGPIADIRKGFHSTFNMLRFVDNEVNPLPIEDWIKSIEKSRSENPKANSVKVVGNFANVVVSGNAANVVLELHRGDKKIFTDHLLLYKFNEGWRIVSKTYYRYP